MKNKFLVLLFGIFLVITLTSVKAYDLNVPVSISINGETLTIQGDNLDWTYNLKTFYNLTTNQTTNKSMSTLQIITLTEENAASLETLLRDMTIQCNRSMSLWEPYSNFTLIANELNRTQEALMTCQGNKTTCENSLESWKTNAAAKGIVSSYDIDKKFNEAKNSLWWAVIVVGIAGIGGTYWFIKRKGKAEKPEGFERDFE